RVAAGAAGLAVGAATGGAALAATAAAGYAQTGSGRYAAGAALGRIQTVANVGEVAAAMGLVEDEELLGGLYAGERRAHSAHAMRMQMQLDGQRLERRRQATQAASAGGNGREQGAGAASSAQEATTTTSSAPTAPLPRERVYAAVGDRWQQLHQPPLSSPPLLGPGPSAALSSPGGGAEVETEGSHVDLRYHAYSLDEQGTVVIEEPRHGSEQPADALTVANVYVQVPELLQQGYVLQQNQDGTLTFWKGDKARAASAQANPEQADEQLLKSKAVTEEGLRQ